METIAPVHTALPPVPPAPTEVVVSTNMSRDNLPIKKDYISGFCVVHGKKIVAAIAVGIGLLYYMYRRKLWVFKTSCKLENVQHTPNNSQVYSMPRTYHHQQQPQMPLQPVPLSKAFTGAPQQSATTEATPQHATKSVAIATPPPTPTITPVIEEITEPTHDVNFTLL